jgi:AcrR family transcriptional regulator
MSQGRPGGDLRTRRTRLALRNALLDLIQTKGFDAIVVQDIADRAMINRVTFYKHYRDKYDLLEHMMQEMLAELSGPVVKLLELPEDQAVFDALVHWLESVSRHASFYRAMLGKQGNPAFAAQLRGYLEAMVSEIILQQRPQPAVAPEGLVDLRFIASGFLGVTEWWLEQQQLLSVRDVATQLHDLLKRVMRNPTSA